MEDLKTLCWLLRTTAEEVLDDISTTIAAVEELEELEGEALDLISNICSVDRETAVKIIAADTAIRMTTARKPRAAEASETLSAALGLRAAASAKAETVSDNNGISLTDIVVEWANSMRRTEDSTKQSA